MLSLTPVKVETSSPDEDGFLVFDDGRSIAVAVHLRHAQNLDERGRWHVEAVFDSLRQPQGTFAGIDEVKAWGAHLESIEGPTEIGKLTIRRKQLE